MTRNEKNLLIFWLPPLSWAALLFVASATTFPPGLPLGPAGLIPHVDKVVHAGLYAVLAVLLRRALRSEQRWSWRRAAAGAFVLASLYGATDEFHQWFTPDRSMDFWDWTADTLGAAVVFLMPGKP
ncbi:MAG: VanZ family protein [Kiritimatiellaeota bacterium]|nr:VanZ family protein [Kiritimatiellota bacterium]